MNDTWIKVYSFTMISTMKRYRVAEYAMNLIIVTLCPFSVEIMANVYFVTMISTMIGYRVAE